MMQSVIATLVPHAEVVLTGLVGAVPEVDGALGHFQDAFALEAGLFVVSADGCGGPIAEAEAPAEAGGGVGFGSGLAVALVQVDLDRVVDDGDRLRFVEGFRLQFAVD